MQSNSAQNFSWTHLESSCHAVGRLGFNAWALQWVSRSITTDPLNYSMGSFFPAINSMPSPNTCFPLGSSMFSFVLSRIVHGLVTTCLSFWPISYHRLEPISSFPIFSILSLQDSGPAYFGGSCTSAPTTSAPSDSFLSMDSLYYLLSHPLCKNGDNRSAIGLVCFFTLQALVSWYLAVFSTFISIFVFAGVVDRRFWVKPRWRNHILILLFIGIALTPFIIPYINVNKTSDFSDRMQDALISADNVHLIDYLHPPQGTLIGQMIPHNPYWIWQENTLYIAISPFLSLLFVLFTLSGVRKIIFLQVELTSHRIFFIGLMLCIGGYLMAKGFVSANGIFTSLYSISQMLFHSFLGCAQPKGFL